MNDFNIVVEKSTLSKNRSNEITGVIYLEVDGNSFPEIGWNDFVIIILNWWGEALWNLLSHNSKQATFRFMDGPYYWECVQKDALSTNIRFIYSGIKDKLVFTSQTQIEQLKNTMIDLIGDLLSFCKKHEWISNEISQLEGIYERLVNLS